MPQPNQAKTAAPDYQAPSAISPAVDISKLDISVSQLLGFDYVFVSSQYAVACFINFTTASNAIMQLIKTLALTAEQTVFITVDDNGDAPLFTRHDFSWIKGQPESMKHTLIQNPEQQEFIKMIWQCSSSHTP